MNKKLLTQLIAIFLITQAVGLFIASNLIQQDVHATIVNDNPEDPINTIALIVYILAFTAVLLIVIKFAKGKFSFVFLKLFELMAVFGTSWIVFAIFAGYFAGTETAGLIGFGIAAIIIALRLAFWKKLLFRNFATMIAVIGAGALIGVSLGIIPVIIFIIALSIYDFIAVFKTKHMVSLAKAITEKNLAFTVAMPTKEHQFELGSGDLVIPLVFASAALSSSSLPSSLMVLAGSLIGLLVTIDYSSKHVGKALPALPLQGILMIAFFAIAKLLGF
jgi:presenilin-like A22 family membrane protease